MRARRLRRRAASWPPLRVILTIRAQSAPIPGGRPHVSQPHSAKPERLHGSCWRTGRPASRRDMEEMIVAGRVSASMACRRVGQRSARPTASRSMASWVHLRNSVRLPRGLLYHKPEGEIVSRDDPQSAPASSMRCRA